MTTPKGRNLLAAGRITGSVGLVTAQITLLFVSRDAGLIMALVCSSLTLPYFIKHKYWDVIALSASCMVVNLAALLNK